jgi:hypothetical protein
MGIGALAGTLLTGGSTSTTTPDGDNGNMVAIMNGQTSMGGYTGYRTTTSGLGGTQSTSHSDMAGFIDPTLARAWNQGIIQPTSSVTSSSLALGIGNSAALDANVSAFPVNSSDMQQAIYNVSNAMAQGAIQASGMKTAFDNALQPGEMYVDELERIGSGYAAINTAAGNAGINLANLTGSTSVVGQGNWGSMAANLMGGDSAVTSALNLYQKYALSTPQQANAALSSSAANAAMMMGQTGKSGLTTSNFWGAYGAELNSGPSAADMQTWSNAATAVSTYDNAQRQMIAAQQSVNSLQIAHDQAQIQALNDQKVVVNGINQSMQSAFSTWQSLAISLTNTANGLMWNSSLSLNTPGQTYSQQSAYYQQLKGKVEGEDMSSPTYTSDIQQLTSFAQTFLTTSKAYYGLSAGYISDYQDVTSTLAGLQSNAQDQETTLGQQMVIQDQQLNALNTQIDSLNLANTNLTLIANNVDALGTDLTAAVSSLGIAVSSASSSSVNPDTGQAYSSGISSGTPDPSSSSVISGGSSSAAASYAQGAPTVAQVAATGGTVLDAFLAQAVADGTASYTASGGYDLSGGATGGLITGGHWGRDSAVVALMPGEVVTSAPEVAAVKRAIHNGTSLDTSALHGTMAHGNKIAAAGHQAVASKLDTLIHHTKKLGSTSLLDRHRPARWAQ